MLRCITGDHHVVYLAVAHIASQRPAADPDPDPHLQARRGMSQLEIEDEVATDLQRATGTADAGAGDSTRLNRVLQLTGAWDGIK